MEDGGAVLFRGVERFGGLAVSWPFRRFALLGQGLGRGDLSRLKSELF